jgi:hypothetical protein
MAMTQPAPAELLGPVIAYFEPRRVMPPAGSADVKAASGNMTGSVAVLQEDDRRPPKFSELVDYHRALLLMVLAEDPVQQRSFASAEAVGRQSYGKSEFPT